MNNHFKHLADMAGFIRFSPEEDPHTPIDWSCDYSVELEKFAELIVQECIKACQSRVGNSDYNTGRMHCASDIRDLFKYSSSDKIEVTKDINYYLALLIDYPRIKLNIEDKWGSIQCRKYIFGLIVDDRDRPSSKVSGFPSKVVDAINELLKLHDEFYPDCKPPTSVWD